MDALTLSLGVNSTKFIMKMDKPVIKEIKNQLGYLIDPNNTAADRLDCGLQTMQAIDLMVRSVQDLEK